MANFVDRGVDNIITDEPVELREVIAERAALTDAERMLLAFSYWLRSTAQFFR